MSLKNMGEPLRILHESAAGHFLISATRKYQRLRREIFGCGDERIRTSGRVTPTAVFETAAFNRSATSPWNSFRAIGKIYHRYLVFSRKHANMSPIGPIVPACRQAGNG